MPGPLHEFLARDHARLDALLDRAAADPECIDRDAYEEFRAGLLHHIAMEEKVLLPDALPMARRLRADHAALAALLVPTPTHALVAAIRGLLAVHNPLEEGPGGVYAACEDIAAAEVDDLLARLRAVPDVTPAAHFDGPRAHQSIGRLLKARSTAGS